MSRALSFRGIGNTLFHHKILSPYSSPQSPTRLSHVSRITQPALRITFCALVVLLLILGLPPTPARADGPFDDDYSYIGTENPWTWSVAWGDIDGDGDLDLALGNEFEPNQVFENVGGVLSPSPLWESAHIKHTRSIALGDVDGDGDLDLAVGNYGEVNQVFENVGGILSSSPLWESPDTKSTRSVAWGDVDGDGDLDLAVGNDVEVNQVFENVGGILSSSPLWESPDCTGAQSVAWGDVDGDGDLDLAVGNYYGANQVFENVGGILSSSPLWEGPEDATDTWSVAWGDVDGDRDLDLAVGNWKKGNQVFENLGGILSSSPLWESPDTADTLCVAWGDVDGDGDLDLAVGNSGVNQVFENIDGILNPSPLWESPDAALYSQSMAWGDVDGDGDLDLAVGNYYASQVFENVGEILINPSPLWESPDTADTLCVAWGDVDGDGDLDLAVGNSGQPNQLYRNNGGNLTLDTAWNPITTTTRSVAWGDVDGDGDLDLATSFGIYQNDQGTLTTEVIHPLSGGSVAWGDWDGDGDLDLATSFGIYQNNQGTLITEVIHPLSGGRVAWGDVDGDGDLDLVVGHRNNPHQLYRNNGGNLTLDTAWNPEARSTSDVAWGDVDGDGNLDLAVGNDGQVNQVFKNVRGILSQYPSWESSIFEFTKDALSVAWGDVDGDGDLDLAVGNYRQVNQVFENARGILSQFPLWESADAKHTRSIALGDVDGDGDLDLAVGNYGEVNQVFENTRQGARALPDNAPSLGLTAPYTSTANFYAASIVLDHPVIPITYTLSDPEGDPVGGVQAFYSPDGGGRWLPAVATTDTITTHLFCSGLEGAVGYWPLEEGSGATAFDASGHGYDLYLHDPVYSTMTPPVLTDSTYALDFDGVDDGAWQNLTYLIDNLQDLTIALWVRPDTIPNPGVARFVTLGNEKAVLRAKDGDLHFYMNIGGSLRHIYKSSVLATGIYQHVAGTYDSADDVMRLYHNGVEVGSLAIAGVVETGNGVRLGSAGEPYDGSMDDVRIYQRALSSTEIVALAHNHYFPNCTHIYTWDTFASGFFGQSDNVVLRMVAYPQPAIGAVAGTYKYYNSTPLYQRPYASATTFPFRVRGTQVRVYSETVQAGNEIAEAMVYRWSEGSGSNLLVDSSGTPFRTDQNGYLQGRGTLGLGDHLLALLPVATALSYDGALQFGSNTNAYVIVPDSASLDLTTFSVGAWIKPVAIKDYWQPLVGKQASTGWLRNYGLFITPNTSLAHFSFQAEDCDTFLSYDSIYLLPTSGG